MRTDVDVRQVSSDSGRSFLNVGRVTSGQIGVWSTDYTHPTYLLMDERHGFYLVQYDSQEWADEDLPKLKEHYPLVLAVAAAREMMQEGTIA